MLNNKVVLITGGTESSGKNFVRSDQLSVVNNRNK